MVTYTIPLDRTDDTWRSITNTGEYMVLAGHTGAFRLRFGITSSSEGFLVHPGESVKVTETVFVKPELRPTLTSNYTVVYAHKA